MQFTPIILNPAGVDKQAPQSELSDDQDTSPPPSKFQRKCKKQAPPAKYCLQSFADQHCGVYGKRTRYPKGPSRDNELCPAFQGEYTIEESVQIFEDMMDAANEFWTVHDQIDLTLEKEV
jgi:hypothetical protein